MATLPRRGTSVRDLDLALPPAPMARQLGGRPLKRWRYVGVYTPELMLCVGDARIGPARQRWWAIALPGGELRERTALLGSGGVALDSPWNGDAAAYAAGGSRAARVRVADRGVRIDLELTESGGVETASPIGERGAYVWTRKQACVPVRGSVEVDGARHAIAGDAAFVDDSAGYHARHTAWNWSAGVGTAVDGRRVGWNLVAGVHDDPAASERTVWVDGEPTEVAPVRFSADLATVAFADGGELRCAEWSVREHTANALLIRSRYRQPFGSFSGSLPGGIELAEGYGVMEDHDVHW